MAGYPGITAENMEKYNIPISMKIRLMKALVWPVVTYGCESSTLSKERTVRHFQSEEASILWSHHEETRELPWERNNARNNATCTQARKTTHGMDRQHQVVDRYLCGREWQRIEISGESMSMVWPTLGSRMANEQNITGAIWCLMKA